MVEKVEKIDKYDEEMFLEYVEGLLPHDKRLAFEQQMLTDARLRNLVAQMVLDRHRLRNMPDETPPADLMDVVHERLERAMLLGAAPQTFSSNHGPGRARLGWGRFVAVAAVAALFTAVAGVFVVTLVQLANDTPIQSTGTATLLPPSMGPAQLVPENVPPPSEQQPTALPPPATPGTSQTPEPLEASSTVAAADVPAAQASSDAASPEAEALPAADVTWFIRAADVPAVQRRLLAWASAYDAAVLDTRQMMVRMPDGLGLQDGASSSSSAAAGQLPSLPEANAPLAIDEAGAIAPTPEASAAAERTMGLIQQIETIQMRQQPAETEALALTMRMDSQAVSHLQTFLETLPGAAIKQQAAAKDEAAVNVEPDFFRAWLSHDAFLPAWLRKPAEASDDAAGEAVSEVLTPLRLPLIEPMAEDAATVEPPPASAAPVSQVVRLLLIQG